MENEIKTNEAEEVKEETPETENVEETPVEEVEPISYESSYLENIEEARMNFLKVYKNLEQTITEVSPIKGYEDAIQAVKDGKEKYEFKFNMFGGENK